VTAFLLEGLMSEFDLFRVMVMVANSPCLNPQEMVNRFLKDEVKNIDIQADPDWWR
jgi:hypothetical protein